MKAGWNFDNSYARLPESLFSRLGPTPVQSPGMIIFNSNLAKSLELEAHYFLSREGIETLAGNNIPEFSEPIAQAYAGHQFGHFTMLGDGRAILLGEHRTSKGERFDIQLKGSGRTPYSRNGDGRAALGPMLREYIISEAMHAMGAPTSRSLAVVSTGEQVFRETTLPGAILTRVASSHIRVGTFQYVSAFGSIEDLKILTNYTLNRHFPQADSESFPALALLHEVIRTQAELVAKWQLIGFIHGVMNTDNMAISGETIDYGPCAFMDVYDPATVFSSIDSSGRYSCGNQPDIAGWNLARFAESLLPVIGPNQEKSIELAQNEISIFGDIFHDNWLNGMRSKLGIFNKEPGDLGLIEELLLLMKRYHLDYTNTFRFLTSKQMEESGLFRIDEFKTWYELWQKRLGRQNESPAETQTLMQASNPVIIPRNHLVEIALEEAVKLGNINELKNFLAVLSDPYNYGVEPDSRYTEPSVNEQYRTYCGT